MKKLLFITPHLGSGAGKAISGLIVNVKGFESKVIMLEKPKSEKYCDICKRNNIEVLIAPDDETIVKLSEESDAVIYNWWAHPLSVGLLDKIGKAKTRLIIWSHINGLQYPELTVEFLDIFDAVMFTSPCSLKNKKFSEEQKKQISSKCSFVYGIGDFSPEKSKHKKDYKISDHLRIGYIGTLDFAKLNPEFPRICHGIRRAFPDAEFILCGGYTKEFEIAYYENYPELQECTSFLGFIDDPEEKLLTFDIFCYPLTKENYATTENALLEAMAAALPIVVLNNPAENEIITNNQTGIVASDIDEFIEKTVYLCEDEYEREKLGTEARSLAIKKYSTEVNVKNFTTCVEKSLNISKHDRNFSNIIGFSIWEKFLYFTGSDREKIIKILNGGNEKLPDIYYSESKGSPVHFCRYYCNDNFVKLSNSIK